MTSTVWRQAARIAAFAALLAAPCAAPASAAGCAPHGQSAACISQQRAAAVNRPSVRGLPDALADMLEASRGADSLAGGALSALSAMASGPRAGASDTVLTFDFALSWRLFSRTVFAPAPAVVTIAPSRNQIRIAALWKRVALLAPPPA